MPHTETPGSEPRKSPKRAQKESKWDLQRESNMHCFEGHDFASRFDPYFLVGKILVFLSFLSFRSVFAASDKCAESTAIAEKSKPWGPKDWKKFNLDLRNSPQKIGFGGWLAWNFQSHLKISRSRIFSIFGPLGRQSPKSSLISKEEVRSPKTWLSDSFADSFETLWRSSRCDSFRTLSDSSAVPSPGDSALRIIWGYLTVGLLYGAGAETLIFVTSKFGYSLLTFSSLN